MLDRKAGGEQKNLIAAHGRQRLPQPRRRVGGFDEAATSVFRDPTEVAAGLADQRRVGDDALYAGVDERGETTRHEIGARRSIDFVNCKNNRAQHTLQT